MKFEPISPILTAIAVLVLFTGCNIRNTVQAPLLEEVPPAQYGQPGSEIPMPPGQLGNTGGRFGYNNANADGSDTQAPPAPRDVRDMGSTTAPEPPKNEKPAAPAPTVYANSVPGNPLVVTLPGKHSSLGQISIEKYDSAGNPTGEPLKRGTPVQIPDPNKPGQKIYFKVP
ncbi:MAG: hypothetical protein VXX36_02630 [Verrucomicrobiota bacterium]|nr:hypothetical protein [Verrucomicrobiota bacterium]